MDLKEPKKQNFDKKNYLKKTTIALVISGGGFCYRPVDDYNHLIHFPGYYHQTAGQVSQSETRQQIRKDDE